MDQRVSEMDRANTARLQDLTAMPDGVLVAQALARDEAAMREIVRRYNQRLFRVARSILRNDADAEDAVQSGYLQAFTHLASFRAEAKFSTWLTRIVLNEAIGRARRNRPTIGVEQIELEQNSSAQIIQFPLLQIHPDPETAMSRQEIRALLEQAVDALPDHFRDVFMLRDVEGLSADETAAQLSIKPETVNTRLFRARRLLRTAIEEQLAPSFTGLFPFDGERCVHMADRVVVGLKRLGQLA
jgi:RNA polymerase sigma-70 factor (ECF subfamily)